MTIRISVFMVVYFAVSTNWVGAVDIKFRRHQAVEREKAEYRDRVELGRLARQSKIAALRATGSARALVAAQRELKQWLEIEKTTHHHRLLRLEYEARCGNTIPIRPDLENARLCAECKLKYCHALENLQAKLDEDLAGTNDPDEISRIKAADLWTRKSLALEYQICVKEINFKTLLQLERLVAGGYATNLMRFVPAIQVARILEEQDLATVLEEHGLAEMLERNDIRVGNTDIQSLLQAARSVRVRCRTNLLRFRQEAQMAKWEYRKSSARAELEHHRRVAMLRASMPVNPGAATLPPALVMEELRFHNAQELAELRHQHRMQRLEPCSRLKAASGRLSSVEILLRAKRERSRAVAEETMA